MQNMLPVTRRPATLAWMWHAPLAGEVLLTRREASLLDLVDRAGGTSDAPALRAEVDAAAEDWAASQRGCLTIVNPSRPATFDGALEALSARGLLRVAGGTAEARDARPRAYVMTEAGRVAVGFARAMGRHLLDVTLDPAGRGARGVSELLEAGLHHGPGFVAATDSGDRCRVESLGADGSMGVVLEDDAAWHRAVLDELEARCGSAWTHVGPDERRGVFGLADALVRSPCEVTVRTVEELPGTRTTLSFREVG